MNEITDRNLLLRRSGSINVLPGGADGDCAIDDLDRGGSRRAGLRKS